MAELAPRVRSALFTPGTDAARLRKAVTVGADGMRSTIARSVGAATEPGAAAYTV